MMPAPGIRAYSPAPGQFGDEGPTAHEEGRRPIRKRRPVLALLKPRHHMILSSVHSQNSYLFCRCESNVGML